MKPFKSIALASAMALLSFQAHAQSSAPAGDTAPADTVLPSVKVTSSADLHSDKNPGFVAKRSTGASKTDTPLIETPRAVTVVTRDQIDAQGMTQLRDVVGYSAGVVSSLRRSTISLPTGTSDGCSPARCDSLPCSKTW